MELRSILLIDDEEAYLYLNEYFLRNCNVECPIEMAADGQQGLQKFEQAAEKPNLILLDMNMPGMDGHGFLAALAQSPHCHHTKVFVLSATELESDRVAALGYKFVYGFLEKPLNHNHVQHILKHFTLVH